MGLATFILQNLDSLIAEWEEFAAKMSTGQAMDSNALRDHARGILKTIATDLEHGQTQAQRREKSRGHAPEGDRASQAAQHGQARVAAGFSVNETVAEYRALRASVLRRWSDCPQGHAEASDDINRFNEAIDQALTESLRRYSYLKDQQVRLFDALLAASPDLTFVVDPRGRLMYANKAFAESCATTPDQSGGDDLIAMWGPFAPDIGQQLADVVRDNASHQGEATFNSRCNKCVTFEYLLIPVIGQDGQCEAIVGAARDVTNRKESEARALRSANYDQLTQLPNRTLFQDRLEQDLKHASRTALPIALMFIDLDGFKEVNDRLGHAAGDTLLKQVAQRITDSVRDTDTVARLGGDEFTVILTEVTVPAHIDAIATNILTALNTPFSLDGSQVSISASIGIALHEQGLTTSDDIVQHADAAMYAAKHAGRNRYHFYRPE